MARKRQSRRCSGTRSTDGKPCGGWAVNGGTVCSAHGGSAPQVKASAEMKIIEAKAERLLYRYGAPRCDDPLEALRLLAGRVLAMERELGEQVNDLRSIRFEDDRGPSSSAPRSPCLSAPWTVPGNCWWTSPS
jgi:hypothetical protein